MVIYYSLLKLLFFIGLQRNHKIEDSTQNLMAHKSEDKIYKSYKHH